MTDVPRIKFWKQTSPPMVNFNTYCCVINRVEDLNISLFTCYPIMFSGIFWFFNICYSLQFFVSTLIYVKKIQKVMKNNDLRNSQEFQFLISKS